MDAGTAETTVVASAPATQEQVQAPAAKVTAKPKKTGNLLTDIATEVESIQEKTKALKLADTLVNDIDTEFFRLGGVFARIQENTWWDGYPSFGAFVLERYGMKERKAYYYIDIYKNLVTKQIPWEKVKALGWTKLKDVAKHLTAENVDEMVAKVSNLTYAEMMAMLKAVEGGGEGGGGESKTTTDVQTMKFKGLKTDQVATVQSALSKCKAEIQTEHDNVALENICAAYLAGTVTVQSTAKTLQEQMKDAGFKEVLTVFEKLFPNIDLAVTVPEEAAQG